MAEPGLVASAKMAACHKGHLPIEDRALAAAAEAAILMRSPRPTSGSRRG